MAFQCYQCLNQLNYWVCCSGYCQLRYLAYWCLVYWPEYCHLNYHHYHCLLSLGVWWY